LEKVARLLQLGDLRLQCYLLGIRHRGGRLNRQEFDQPGILGFAGPLPLPAGRTGAGRLGVGGRLQARAGGGLGDDAVELVHQRLDAIDLGFQFARVGFGQDEETVLVPGKMHNVHYLVRTGRRALDRCAAAITGVLRRRQFGGLSRLAGCCGWYRRGFGRCPAGRGGWLAGAWDI